MFGRLTQAHDAAGRPPDLGALLIAPLRSQLSELHHPPSPAGGAAGGRRCTAGRAADQPHHAGRQIFDCDRKSKAAAVTSALPLLHLLNS